MSAVVTNTLRSLAPSTSPPAVQRGDGGEVGWFARAWVNFNGTGTVAIRAAGNVSSITDNGTGDYTVNFATAFADAHFSAGALSSGLVVRSAATASSVRLLTATYGGTTTDYADNLIAIFR